MKLPFAILLTIAGAGITASAADARQGCGRGYERGPRAHCRPIYARNQAWVVGRYYDGRGYWDGRRWISTATVIITAGAIAKL